MILNKIQKIIVALSLLIGLCLSGSVVAQNLVISGNVFDSDNVALPFASVRGYSTPDSVFISGVMTDNAGAFSLKFPEGQYYLEIGFISMQPIVIPISKRYGAVDIGNITLYASSITTSEVSVIADKSIAELKLDKRVYNVGADLNNQGANATDVLENIPSITVDTEGNVSLRGNSGVRILIDGKFSGYSSTPEALQQLQADMIDRIEVITNASARFDAQGDAGIINIILKKNALLGLNGSAYIRAGYFPSLGSGFNLNYKKNRWGINFSYDFRMSDRPNNSSTFLRMTSADTTFAYRQTYEGQRKTIGHSGNLGVNYDINSKNTVAASVGIRSREGDNFIDRQYENLNSENDLIYTNSRLEWNKSNFNIIEGNISYDKKFEKEGSSWITEAKWFRDLDNSKSDYKETSTESDFTSIENSVADVIETNLMVQSDLIIPFGQEGKFETGVRTQQREMVNKFGFSQLLNDTWFSPEKFNDEFNYSENIHAGYVMGSNTFGKWGIQAGLRGEFSDVTTEQISIKDSNINRYFNLFPSAALSYQSNELRTFQLSYSRRINRPGQWMLMPFVRFGDNREMMVGNPYLKPELSDSYEAGMMQYLNKGSLLTTVYYRHTNNGMDRMSIAGDDGIIYRRPMNVSDRDAVGFEINGNYELWSFLRLTSGFNVYYLVVNGNFDNNDFQTQDFTWTNRTSLNFTLKNKKTRVQIASNYEAPRVNPQGRSLSIYYLDAGLSQDIGKNATLGLNVRDIFNTRRWRHEVNTESIYSQTEFQWRPRDIRVVFTYRFNQKPDQNGKMQQAQDFNMEGGE